MLLTAVMPSKKSYDLVSDDGYDSQVPLHNDEAFRNGISFQSKYIGTLDVPRPSSKVEIVAAMRRIRYEFKAKAIKKRKVNVIVSLDGVKVQLRKKRKKNIWQLEESRNLILQHAIYRIFYVSHDSQDLKIWSYIARDGATNVFKCNVFKTYKKDQAMLVVRTIGQAFEVCHKISGSITTEDEVKEVAEKSGKKIDDTDTTPTTKQPPATPAHRDGMSLPLNDPNTPKRKIPPMGGTIVSPLPTPVPLDVDTLTSPSLPLSSHHRLQLLGQRLDQQQQQTQVAIAQAHFLKDQLAAETAARIEAQARSHQLLLNNRDLLKHLNELLEKMRDIELSARSHQLLLNNRELLNHLNELVEKMRDMELSAAGLTPSDFSDSPAQIPELPDPTTPQCGQVYILDCEGVSPTLNIPDLAMFENTQVAEVISPDSGHRDMSSDSLSSSATPNRPLSHTRLPKSVSEARDLVKNQEQRSERSSGNISVDTVLSPASPNYQHCPPCNSLVNGVSDAQFYQNCQFQTNNNIQFRHSMPDDVMNRVPPVKLRIGGNTVDQLKCSSGSMIANGAVDNHRPTKRSESFNVPKHETIYDDKYFTLDGHGDVIDKRCQSELKRFSETNLSPTSRNLAIYDEIQDVSLTNDDESSNILNAPAPKTRNRIANKLEDCVAESSARRNVMINHVTDSPRRSTINNFSVRSHLFTPPS